MEAWIKTSLLTVPIISLGGILLYSSIIFRTDMDLNGTQALFFTGAIVLAIGLAIRDVKRNEALEAQKK